MDSIQTILIYNSDNTEHVKSYFTAYNNTDLLLSYCWRVGTLDLCTIGTILTSTASFISCQLITWVTRTFNCNSCVQTLMSTGIVHFAPNKTNTMLCFEEYCLLACNTTQSGINLPMFWNSASERGFCRTLLRAP